MNKFCGYIAYRYNEEKDWFCEEYIIYDEYDNSITWTEDENNATIFSSIDVVKAIYPGEHPELLYKKIMMVSIDN